MTLQLKDCIHLERLICHTRPDLLGNSLRDRGCVKSLNVSRRLPIQRQRHQVRKTLMALDKSTRLYLNDIAEDILMLTDQVGQRVVSAISRGTPIAQMPDQYQRALWLYHTDTPRFQEALDARQTMLFNDKPKYTSGFVVPAELSLIDSPQQRTAFQVAIKEHFDCDVSDISLDIFKLSSRDCVHQQDRYKIIVHRKSAPIVVDCFGENDVSPHVLTPVQRSVIVYEPTQGYLDVSSLNAEECYFLARTCASQLLGAELVDEKLPLKQFDIQRLARPFHFDIEGENISSVRVTELTLGCRLTGSFTLRIGPDDPDDIYSFVKSHLHPDFSLEQYRISEATISVNVKKTVYSSARQVVMTLRNDNKYALKIGRGSDLSLCDRLLKKWNLIQVNHRVIHQPFSSVAA